MIVPDFGAVHTNFSEMIGSVVAKYCSKRKFHHADTQRTKTLCGLAHVNTMSLFCNGTNYIWELEVLRELELGHEIKHESPGSGFITRQLTQLQDH